MVEFGMECPSVYITGVSADARMQRGAATCGPAGGDCQLFPRQLMHMTFATNLVLLRPRHMVSA